MRPDRPLSGNAIDRSERQPLRRRKRGLRPGLRAKLLDDRSGEESLADSFRRLLLQEMNRRDLREVDLADACECSLENIRQIFDGGTGLRFDTADKLCRSLGLRLALSLEEPRAAQIGDRVASAKTP